MPKYKSTHTREYKVFLWTLREAREEAGLVQKDVADAIGLNQSEMSKSERGERRIDVVELRGMCKRIGMSLEVFVRRYEANLRKRSMSRSKKNPDPKVDPDIK